MKNVFFKYLIFFFVAVVFFVPIFRYYLEVKSQSPEKTIAQYYEMMRDQETVLPGEVITEEENQSLKDCKDDFNCFLKFYEDYNERTTLEKTISNLSLLLKENPNYVDYCHQMMHGIAHSELRKNGGDLGKTLTEFTSGRYFKNISTCGSGFFHGALEESVKEEKDKDKLVDYFTNVCNMDIVKNTAGSDCIHGLGHAAYIQLDYNETDALYVCNKVAKSTYDKFNCYTGIFMEANLQLPLFLLIENKDNSFQFKLCDVVSDELQKRACFFETVLQFKHFTPKTPDGRYDYAGMINNCKIFHNDLYRLICVKNISLRSISENSQKDLKRMCIDNTSSRAERIFCVVGFAHRLAHSIEEKRTTEYYKIYDDICKNLSADEVSACQRVIRETPEKAYIVDESDLKI
jgi:hypothetical protein